METEKLAKAYIEKYQNNPVQWAEDFLGVSLWSKQKEILTSVFQYPITAVRSCHAVGKTFVSAVVVLAFLFLRIPSIVLTTAPTFYQVRDLLWGELNQLFLRLKGFPGKMLTTRFVIDSDWFAEGISPKQAVNFQGYHSKHILVVLDESAGIKEEIVTGVTALMSAGDCHVLHLGNPLTASGHFWELFFGQKESTYKTKSIHIGYADTPKFTGEKVPDYVAKSLISPEYVEYMRQRYGESSLLFRSKCLGEFSDEDSLAIIPVELAMSAFNRELEEDCGNIITMGIDVGRTVDRTVYTIVKGNRVLYQESENGTNTMHIIGKARNLAMENQVQVIAVDEVGIGAGVYDGLVETTNLEVVPVNTGHSSKEERYYNLRAELWFKLRDWLRKGSLKGCDEEIVDELTSVRYSYKFNGKLAVEDKEEIKKRLGKSTDLSDSLMLALHAQGVQPSKILSFSVSYSADSLLSKLGIEM